MTIVDLYVTLFSGFLQTGYSVSNGFVGLEDAACDILNGSKNCRVRLLPWNANASDAAEVAWRKRPARAGHRYHQIHLVGGYSLGGHKAMEYCWELERRGGCRAHVFTCDAVKRSSVLPGGNAALGSGKLTFPLSVVDEIVAYRQCNPRWQWSRAWSNRKWGCWPDFLRLYQPAGHDIFLGPHYEVPYTVVSDRHQYIDNNAGFHREFLDAVAMHKDTANIRYMERMSSDA